MIKKYIAFLRGINISGKNKIPMAELKECTEKLGFTDVRTYLNSGNIAFSSNEDDNQNIAQQFEEMIKDRFGFTIPVLVIAKEELEDALLHAPEWWGNNDKEVYDNLIFIIRPVTYQQVFNEIGKPTDGLERILEYKEIIFWSFSRKDYQKTNWWTITANASISNKLTIRTAGTVRKICGM